MAEPQPDRRAGNGLQLLGILIAIIGVGFAIVGYTDLTDDVDQAVKVRYLFETALPALVGGCLLWGVGAILFEMRRRP